MRISEGDGMDGVNRYPHEKWLPFGEGIVWQKD